MLSKMPNNHPEKQRLIRGPFPRHCRSKCAFSGDYDGRMGSSAPVEYAVAVDLYLDQAPISGASRRVYRISLASWAWPLVGKPAPRGAERRGAAPPAAPLALLDDP